MKCRITIELQPENGASPVFGNLIDVSLGGCYVETSAILTAGTNLKLVFSIDDGKLYADGTVARLHPGSGIAIQFKELNREDKAKMHRILEFVQNSTTLYDNRYYDRIADR
jgi:hypothetical protein